MSGVKGKSGVYKRKKPDWEKTEHGRYRNKKNMIAGGIRCYLCGFHCISLGSHLFYMHGLRANDERIRLGLTKKHIFTSDNYHLNRVLFGKKNGKNIDFMKKIRDIYNKKYPSGTKTYQSLEESILRRFMWNTNLREKQSRILKGKHKSDEMRKKLSLTNTGRKLTPEWRENISKEKKFRNMMRKKHRINIVD
jgi:hypothetical protein